MIIAEIDGGNQVVRKVKMHQLASIDQVNPSQSVFLHSYLSQQIGRWDDNIIYLIIIKPDDLQEPVLANINFFQIIVSKY
jgi:hypothetical protein